MGVEYGFAAVASLDANPFDIKRMFEERGLKITTWCAHAEPARSRQRRGGFGTMQIIKAVRLAAAVGVEHVITSEGDPKTAFGHNLTDAGGALPDPRAAVRAAAHRRGSRRQDPARTARQVHRLHRPHGEDPGAVRLAGAGRQLRLRQLLARSGTDPVAMVKRLADKIEHVHWKDWPAEMEAVRGKQFGAGMSGIPLGTGVVDVRASSTRWLRSAMTATARWKSPATRRCCRAARI
ncbi:MAG: hypothetical protein MZW92_19845 [Comamonadaceae bacterium]|nr:hypothetical protein [Comamonadaceae bacterium]